MKFPHNSFLVALASTFLSACGSLAGSESVAPVEAAELKTDCLFPSQRTVGADPFAGEGRRVLETAQLGEDFASVALTNEDVFRLAFMFDEIGSEPGAPSAYLDATSGQVRALADLPSDEEKASALLLGHPVTIQAVRQQTPGQPPRDYLGVVVGRGEQTVSGYFSGQELIALTRSNSADASSLTGMVVEHCVLPQRKGTVQNG